MMEVHEVKSIIGEFERIQTKLTLSGSKTERAWSPRNGVTQLRGLRMSKSPRRRCSRFGAWDLRIDWVGKGGLTDSNRWF